MDNYRTKLFILCVGNISSRNSLKIVPYVDG